MIRTSRILSKSHSIEPPPLAKSLFVLHVNYLTLFHSTIQRGSAFIGSRDPSVEIKKLTNACDFRTGIY